MGDSPYSADSSRADFWLFPKLKKGKRFPDVEDMKTIYKKRQSCSGF
jgi:hypothetical protein